MDEDEKVVAPEGEDVAEVAPATEDATPTEEEEEVA